jgi:phosphate transport system permease protein
MQMFNWISRPQEAFHLNAAGAGLILILVTLAMNGLAFYLRFRSRRRVYW